MTRSLLLLLCTLPACGAAAQTRPLSVDDLFAIKELDAPHVSPEGKWVAYTVESLDPGKDESDKDVWMAPLAGGEPVRVTSSPKSESMPRFSPDGRYLAFLSGRDGKKTQVWLLDRQGGEAQRLTAFPGGVSALGGRRTPRVWPWWCPTPTRTSLSPTMRRTRTGRRRRSPSCSGA